MANMAFTEAAAMELKQALIDSDAENSMIRIVIVNKGCVGLQMQMEIEDSERPGDIKIDVGGFNVVIDPQSMPHLEDTTLDHIKTLNQTGFKLNNQKPMQGGGCGSCKSGCS